MSDSKELTTSGRRRPPAAGKGRPKGTPNKVTRQVKDMVVKALEQAGGVAYLVRCAKDPKTAGAFLTLVGKTMPLQVTGEGGGPVQTMTAQLTLDEFRQVAAEMAGKV